MREQLATSGSQVCLGSRKEHLRYVLLKLWQLGILAQFHIQLFCTLLMKSLINSGLTSAAKTSPFTRTSSTVLQS